MTIQAHELNDLATSLAQPGASEAQLRAAASRSYYCVFHSLVPFIAKLPKSAACPAGVNHVTHSEISERIREWKVSGLAAGLVSMKGTKASLQRSVDTARALRIKADYRLGDELSLSEALQQIERGRAVLRAVSSISDVINPPAKSEVVVKG